MFGYVKTDVPNMYVKDTVLYKSMYCGLCKGIGKTCGLKGRFALNYDLTFLSIFFHNIMGVDVKIEKQKCIIHCIRNRPIAIPDSLTERIACLNVILAYHKLKDDIIDNNKGRLKRAFFTSNYRRAKIKEPIFDEIVSKMYNDLLEFEKNNSDSIDMVSDPFGIMMVKVFKETLGEELFTEDLSLLAYNLGKWIYLIDALDDFDKDKKKKNFNVFANCYKDILDKQDLIQQKQNDLIYIFGTILSDIEKLSNNIKYCFNHDLTDNVFIYGLKTETKRIMENKKCKNIIKY